MRVLMLCIMGIIMAGCGETPISPSKSLLGPPKFAMLPPEPLPEPVAGKSCTVDNAQVRRAAGDRGEQVITLQRWVRRVTKG